MKNSEFQSVTIFVLASNETTLLRKTIDELLAVCDKTDLEKIVIVLKNKACPSYSEAERILSENPDKKIELYFQKADSLEGCIGEVPLLAKTSHFLIMTSDMEMNPFSVGQLILKAKEKPTAIICASKWHKESSVEGYGKLHEMGSRIMNCIVSLLLCKKATDPFSIFQIFPDCVYKKLNFNNLSPVTAAYEYTLRALRCGFDYIEIPTTYKKRTEGKSTFSFIKLCIVALRFIFTAVRLKFTRINKLFK